MPWTHRELRTNCRSANVGKITRSRYRRGQLIHNVSNWLDAYAGFVCDAAHDFSSVFTLSRIFHSRSFCGLYQYAAG